MLRDLDHFTVKVTDGEGHAYFVYFTRDGHDLVSVFEFKQIYTPALGAMPVRVKRAVAAARGGILKTRETTPGENQ